MAQIDLSCAHNSSNLWILNRLIIEANFWSKEEQQTSRFLVTNSSTYINSKIVKERNGLPQGSLLSPLLYNIYLNRLLVDHNSYSTSSEMIVFADDIILITPSFFDFKTILEKTEDFFEWNYLYLNKNKS